MTNTSSTNISDRSEELQDLIGNVPSAILKWGLIFLITFLTLVILFLWIIKYPDTVVGRATVISENGPVELVSKNSGYIFLMVENDTHVKLNQVIGSLDSQVSLDDLEKLTNVLDEVSAENSIEIPSNLSIGELSILTSQVEISLLNIRSHINQNFIRKEIMYIDEKISSLKKIDNNLTTQLGLYGQELALMKKQLGVDSLLFDNNVLSRVDYENSLSNYLQQKRLYESEKGRLIRNQYEITDLVSRQDNLKTNFDNEAIQLNKKMKSDIDALKFAIENWKRKNLFIAPFEGNLIYLNYYANGDFITSGTKVFSIIPNKSSFYVQSLLPINSSGKVKVGIKVNVSLDSYPSDQYGLLEGEVEYISEVPSQIGGQEYYLVRVSLLNELNTTYDIQIPKQNLLKGSIEYITEDLRLIDRIFYRFKSLNQTTP